MKIYKFKDMSDEKKLSHFYQIVLKKTIWCAKPDSFNDESEFKIKLNYSISFFTASLLSQVVSKYPHFYPPDLSVCRVLKNNRLEEIVAPIIDDMLNECRRTIGVVSFSMTKNDNLWSEYGGKGNGVCIEINIPDSLVGKSYYPVVYVPEKIIHIDSFLESALFDDRVRKIFGKILSTKTMEWSSEKEIRFIAKLQEAKMIIDGSISEITFGARVPAPTFKQIEKKIGCHCKANNIKIVKQ